MAGGGGATGILFISGETGICGVPQYRQNLWVSWTSLPHFGQVSGIAGEGFSGWA
jgi:hypothetical protein